MVIPRLPMSAIGRSLLRFYSSPVPSPSSFLLLQSSSTLYCNSQCSHTSIKYSADIACGHRWCACWNACILHAPHAHTKIQYRYTRVTCAAMILHHPTCMRFKQQCVHRQSHVYMGVRNTMNNDVKTNECTPTQMPIIYTRHTLCTDADARRAQRMHGTPHLTSRIWFRSSCYGAPKLTQRNL